MKANELRIGNYVIEYRNVVVTVDSINKNFINCRENPETHFIHDLTAIPLTEEWLLKFGFVYAEFTTPDNDGVNRGKKYTNKDYFKHPKLSDNITIYLPYNNFSYFVGNVTIQYVHQLQNIYFALTGEELTINDE